MSRVFLAKSVLAVTVSLAGASFAVGETASKPVAPPVKAAVIQPLHFTNEMKDGKKTWLPAVANIKSGTEVEITLTNTLAEPHGFNVPGLVDNVIVGPNETKIVHATAKTPGHLKFSCQLHPAHVGGEITVQ